MQSGQYPDSPVPSLTAYRSTRASPGWCHKQIPWYSRHRAGCAWGTQMWHAGPTVASSFGHRTCSHSTHSLGGTRPRDSEITTGVKQLGDGMPRVPGASSSTISLDPMYLVGLPTEVTTTEFTLEAALGAVVLQMGRQVTPAQLGRAAIRAGDYIEAASVQVALVGQTAVSICQRRVSPSSPPEPHL